MCTALAAGLMRRGEMLPNYLSCLPCDLYKKVLSWLDNAVRLSLFYELYFINLKYFGMKDFLRHKLEKGIEGGQGETIQNNCQNSGN